jgi:hypothetical protein
MLSPFGEEVEISFELPTGEPQQVDVWFIPKSHQPIAELGFLGKMATTPALLVIRFLRMTCSPVSKSYAKFVGN